MLGRELEAHVFQIRFGTRQPGTTASYGSLLSTSQAAQNRRPVVASPNEEDFGSAGAWADMAKSATGGYRRPIVVSGYLFRPTSAEVTPGGCYEL
jgi:hypothetical protein